MIDRVEQADGNIHIFDRSGAVLATVIADDGLISWSSRLVRTRRGAYTFAYDATGAIRRIERTDAPMIEPPRGALGGLIAGRMLGDERATVRHRHRPMTTIDPAAAHERSQRSRSLLSLFSKFTSNFFTIP